jgi:hypothetical protein
MFTLSLKSDLLFVEVVVVVEVGVEVVAFKKKLLLIPCFPSVG